MKVMMLGWEYPPNINGGLGTACQGLTTSLAHLGVQIDFIVPRLSGAEHAPHMTLLDSYADQLTDKGERPHTGGGINTLGIPSLLSPYLRPEAYDEWVEYYRSGKGREDIFPDLADLLGEIEKNADKSGAGLYGPDLFTEVERYTRNVIAIAMRRKFDLIHAHDWMTYPAGIALAKLTGKPLLVHVHSLEYDRSGAGVNPRIHQIEGAGVKTADIPIAVSYYTRTVVNAQHNVPLEKIAVVHNGVYTKEVIKSYRDDSPDRQKLVLFLGRITFQKGPDYFIEAAAKVLTIMKNVVFVMAGTGDMLPHIQRRVQEMGMTQNFMFPGFLKGAEIEKMFSMADLYIMPSVSEPFGITPLEAMSHDVPVIISKQSGVSEILNNALKIDFWDVDRMAHLIVGVLKYPEIREDIVGMAREEVRRIHWDAAATKVLELYRQALANAHLQQSAGNKR